MKATLFRCPKTCRGKFLCATLHFRPRTAARSEPRAVWPTCKPIKPLRRIEILFSLTAKKKMRLALTGTWQRASEWHWHGLESKSAWPVPNQVMGLPSRGGPGLGSIGCSQDKPMLLISSSQEKRVAIKPRASRDREFYVNESQPVTARFGQPGRSRQGGETNASAS